MATPTKARASADAGGRLSEWVGNDSLLAIRLHYVSLAVTFVVIAYLSRNQWYFNDDFMVLTLIQGRGIRGVFEPYAEHWLSVPKLLAHFNFMLVGFRTYWPTTLVVLAVNTAVGHLLWRVMRQIGIAAWIATGLAAVYLVSAGNAMRDLLQFGWFGAVALGLGAILCANSRDPGSRRDFAAAGLMTIAIPFHSGVAIGMLLVVALVAVLRRGIRAALVQVAPPIALYAVWLVVIGRERVQRELPDGVALVDVPHFVVTELPGTVAATTRLAAPLATLVLVIVGGWLVLRWRLATTERAPAYATAIVVVALYVAVALGRTDVAYRYSYLAWLLVLPAIGLVLHDLGREPRLRCALGIGVSVVMGLAGLYYFVQITHDQGVLKRELRTLLLEAAERTETDGYVPEVLIRNDLAPLLRARHVAEWQRDGKFPSLESLSPETWRRLAPLVQVRYVRKPPPSFNGSSRPVLESVDGAETRAGGAGCTRIEPAGERARVRLSVTKLASISVAGPASALVRLPQAAFDGADAEVSVPVPKARPEYLELAPGIDVELVLPGPAASEICGLSG